jgi:hypothetical protein
MAVTTHVGSREDKHKLPYCVLHIMYPLLNKAVSDGPLPEYPSQPVGSSEIDDNSCRIVYPAVTSLRGLFAPAAHIIYQMHQASA